MVHNFRSTQPDWKARKQQFQCVRDLKFIYGKAALTTDAVVTDDDNGLDEVYGSQHRVNLNRFRNNHELTNVRKHRAISDVIHLL
jgi:hypothetical protein